MIEMSKYKVTYWITTRCTAVVEAESPEEAIEIAAIGEHPTEHQHESEFCDNGRETAKLVE